MKSFLRIILWTLSGFFASCSYGQTTYTQTTHSCTMAGCADAQFVAPDSTTVTASWSVGMEYCGYQNVTMLATWNGVSYSDGKASMRFIGSVYNGHNYYPWAVYEFVGTFNNGTITITEHNATYRGCAGGKNLDGNAVVN